MESPNQNLEREPADVINLSELDNEKFQRLKESVNDYEGRVDLIVHPYYAERPGKAGTHLRTYRFGYVQDSYKRVKQGIHDMLMRYQTDFVIHDDSRLPIILEEKQFASELKSVMEKDGIPTQKDVFMIATENSKSQPVFENFEDHFGFKVEGMVDRYRSLALLFHLAHVKDLRISGGYLTYEKSKIDEEKLILTRCVGIILKNLKACSKTSVSDIKVSLSEFTFPENTATILARDMKGDGNLGDAKQPA